MPSLLLLSLLLGQVVAPAHPSELVAVARVSPRPAECQLPVSGRREPRESLWERAQTPGRSGYCSALARGYARLQRDPKAALQAAEAVQHQWGDRVAPLVLRGRALVRLARFGEAFADLSRARKLDRHSLDDPSAGHDFAVSAALTGNLSDALAAYRALVVEVGLLSSEPERSRVYVEAAVWAMTAGTAGLDEAIGYLEEARRRGSPPEVAPFVLGALALALDRQGHAERARGVSHEAGGPWSLLRRAATELEGGPPGARRELPVVPLPELHAMVAVLAESEDRRVASEQWQAAIDTGGGGAWRTHAEQKARSLGASASARRPP